MMAIANKSYLKIRLLLPYFYLGNEIARIKATSYLVNLNFTIKNLLNSRKNFELARNFKKK